MPELSAGESRALREALVASAVVTLGVAATGALLRPAWHTTAVAFIFFGAVWVLVWRGDDEAVRRAGVSLGGLVIPGPLAMGELLRAAARALAWAAGLLALVAVPFFFAWRWWWGPRLTFSLGQHPLDFQTELLAQILIIALPEEAFYRGYLQSRLDEAWPPRWRVLGTTLGPGFIATAAIFALGHLATVPVPARLAVFFPALVFGWLRARTGGIGASTAFHAGCNVYSLLLGRGYGLY
jgi:membrane protease YdiL (CAAX protease family)